MPQYLLVYRSAVADKLFWGLDDKDNTMLKLATVKANLTEFPAGCAFEVRFLSESFPSPWCSGTSALWRPHNAYHLDNCDAVIGLSLA